MFAAPFRSYGLLLIIEHQPEYHTLLWGFAELDVEVGDQVRAGQIVGVMASDAGTRSRAPRRAEAQWPAGQSPAVAGGQ